MFLDLTVVYFAFGAPVGVYEITRDRRSPRAAAMAVVHFALWPLFTVASLRRWFAIETPEQSLEGELDGLRTEFEAFVDGREIRAMLEFRDAYSRYTGLAMALSQTNGGTSKELFAISGREDGDIATRCLERRNSRRLEFHLLQAKNEFDDVVTKMSAADPKVTELARQLSQLIKD